MPLMGSWFSEIKVHWYNKHHSLVMCFTKNAVVFLTKCIQIATARSLLNPIFNSEAIALLLKTTRSDDYREQYLFRRSTSQEIDVFF